MACSIYNTTKEVVRCHLIKPGKFWIAAARYFDECLSRFYKEMSRKALSAKVREMLENLQAMEQREQLVLSKIALGLKPA